MAKNKLYKVILGISMTLLESGCTKPQKPDFKTLYTSSIDTLETLSALYPKTIEEIELFIQDALRATKKDLEQILAIKNANRTFENTVQALDHASSLLSSASGTIGMLTYVHPDKTMLDALENGKTLLQNESIELFMNPDLYHAVQYCHDHQTDKLSDQDKLLLEDALIEFKKQGLHLPQKKLNQAKELYKAIAKLQQDFKKNINQNNSTISVSKKELDGVSQNFLDKLKRDGDLYVVTMDFPIYKELMEECHDSKTRKKIYLLKSNCAYPANDTILSELLHKQQELAELIGYPNFASLDLATTSAKNIKTVDQFLTTLQKAAYNKAKKEIALLTQDLPDNVECDNGVLNPWDYLYLVAQYKKKHFNIEESKIAEYFPAEQTLTGMLNIYQDFLHLTFKQVTPAWSWHPDVQLIEIYRNTEFLGYLFLDLYPRPNKFKHACHYGQLSSFQINGKNIASVGVIIANFPQATESKPALLTHNAVTTFFHEFGHAMHHALGRTKHASHAGTNVKSDFVETPSQMFEQWMSEPNILEQISSHYLTKESLPIEIINQKIALKQFDSGMHFLRQTFFGLFSLHSMTDQAPCYNPAKLWKQMNEKFFDGLITYHDQNHGYATFGHISSSLYASKYYAYAWTEIFALDLFDQIKKLNFNEESKQKVIKLLSSGGSILPSKLLEEFLGRTPTQEAFLNDFGLQ